MKLGVRIARLFVSRKDIKIAELEEDVRRCKMVIGNAQELIRERDRRIAYWTDRYNEEVEERCRLQEEAKSLRAQLKSWMDRNYEKKMSNDFGNGG